MWHSVNFFKMGHPRLFFVLFSCFQTNITIFTTNQCEKCPSSVGCWNSNPLPLEHESPPITTTPGLILVCIFEQRRVGRVRQRQSSSQANPRTRRSSTSLVAPKTSGRKGMILAEVSTPIQKT